MSPGSACLGLSPVHIFLLAVSLYPSDSNLWGTRQSPVVPGGQGILSKVPPAPAAPSCISPTWSTHTLATSQQTPVVSLAVCTLGPGAPLGFAISRIPRSGCTQGRVPGLLASPFLCSQGRAWCQHHTVAPATEALGNMSAQESSQTQRQQRLTLVGLRALCRYGLVFTPRAPEVQWYADACWDPQPLLQWHCTHTFITPGWKEPGWKEPELFWHLYPSRQAQP